MARKLVYLEWEDAQSGHNRWKSEEEALAFADNDHWVVKEVGWILRESKDRIVLVSQVVEEIDGEPVYGNIMKIPKPWILRRVNLTPYITKKKGRK